jgi:succinoglycan biosynthesis transport protein ExoP
LNNRYRPAPGTALAMPMPMPESNLPFIPEQPAHHGMSLAQLVAMLRARWKPIVIIAVSITVLGAVAIKTLPRTYTATATLIANSDVKDPLAGRDFPVEMIANYVSTQIELLTSPIVLLPVVDRLRLTEDKDFTAGFSGSSEALREFVEKNLSLSLQVERGTGGQLIYVSASSKDAGKAAEIANAVADVYMEQDRRRLNDPANERAQRYVEELAELRTKATIAQDKVTAFRKQNGISDITANPGDAEVQVLDSLTQRLLETQNLRRTLEAKEPGLPSNDRMTADPVQTLKTQLETQLSQLAQLQGTYGPQHPKIRELQAQIAITRQSMADEHRAVSENNQSELARTRELEQKYLRAVAEQKAKVADLRQSQDEGSKLVLELESAKSVYKHALDGFDQIMFQAVANHTNVSVVSRAVPPLKASKPNKVKLMLMALVAGLGLGLVVPLTYEMFFDRRLRCRDDMEREFGITVLAQLDAVPALARTT